MIFLYLILPRNIRKKILKLVESLHILKLFNFYIEKMKEMK